MNKATCFWVDLYLGVDFFTHNLATQQACTQVGDLLYPGVRARQFHLRRSCINLRNDPQNGLFKHFMGPFFQRIHQEPITHQCVCITAAGSWEPAVAGEYLMREWILSLGRLSTVCIRNRAHSHTQTHTGRHTHMYTHTRQVLQFLCCSTALRQAG